MVGSPILHLLIQGSDENNCNWSIVVIYGEEAGKKTRKWCDRWDALCQFSHFLGELGEKIRNGAEKTSDFYYAGSSKLKSLVITACFTFLDKVTWEFISLGISWLTDSTKNWVELSDPSACTPAWILASNIISQPLVASTIIFQLLIATSWVIFNHLRGNHQVLKFLKSKLNLNSVCFLKIHL